MWYSFKETTHHQQIYLSAFNGEHPDSKGQEKTGTVVKIDPKYLFTTTNETYVSSLLDMMNVTSAEEFENLSLRLGK